MVVLGIDPGYGRCGYGVIQKDQSHRNGWTHIASGVITTPAGSDFPDRLAEIATDIQSLIATFQPNMLVMEQLFFAKNTTTALKVAQVRGVITYLSRRAELDFVEVKPNEVKQALTGYGAADKKQMQEMVKHVFGLASVPKPDDAADALAVAWTGASKNAFS